jgi:hypothetical protein
MADQNQITAGVFVGIVLGIGCIECQIADQRKGAVNGKCARGIDINLL